jgi:hypothetical protein
MPTEIMPIELATAIFLQAAILVAAGFASAPITTFIVQVLKYLPFTKSWPAENMSTYVGLLLTIIEWVVIRLGFQGQFESVLSTILTIGPALLQLVITWKGSSVIYNQIVGRPLVGKQRTP